MNKFGYLRIGFDDERAKNAVYADFAGRSGIDLIGLWKPHELKRILATGRLNARIADLACDLARGVIDIDEAVRRVSEAADKVR